MGCQARSPDVTTAFSFHSRRANGSKLGHNLSFFTAEGKPLLRCTKQTPYPEPYKPPAVDPYCQLLTCTHEISPSARDSNNCGLTCMAVCQVFAVIKLRPRFLLIPPMCCQAMLGNEMHLGSPNLDFHRDAVIPNHHSVEGPVAVVLGILDVVLEPVWHRLPHLVHLQQAT